MRVLAALGGNALLRRGETADIATQRANAERAAAALAEIAATHELIVTHGNGPQVGLLALQAEADPALPAWPMDVLDAETEGMIGHLLELALRSRLPECEIATLLTQIEVDPDDPAFGAPTKPIGPTYDEAQARALARERGWKLAPDRDGLRRVVASPEPGRILALPSIARLVEASTMV
ncbi:MAG: carbamate kinase, partial [Sphingomonas sp.]|nr:carbamate kinase [Sphingomonas sp.]